MNPFIVIYSSNYSPYTHRRCKGRGGKIPVGTVMKGKLGELEGEFKEIFTRWMRKYLTSVIQGVSVNRRLLVRFYDGCEKDLT